jgi:hypothetical protein
MCRRCRYHRLEGEQMNFYQEREVARKFQAALNAEEEMSFMLTDRAQAETLLTYIVLRPGMYYTGVQRVIAQIVAVDVDDARDHMRKHGINGDLFVKVGP